MGLGFGTGGQSGDTGGAGGGDVVGPLTNTNNKVPQWDGDNSLVLKDGLTVGADPNDLVQLNSSGALVLKGLLQGQPATSITPLNNAAATRLTGVVTISTLTAHYLVTGQEVVLAGWTMPVNQINGLFLVTGTPTATSFTIASTGANETSTVAGTITTVAVLELGAVPTTPINNTDVLIGSSGINQWPLTIQGALGQKGALQVWQDSTGVAVAVVYPFGQVQATSLYSQNYLLLGNAGVGLLWYNNTYTDYDVGINRISTTLASVVVTNGTNEGYGAVYNAAGRIYGRAVANPIASLTVANHTTNGTICTITTTAVHSLVAGQIVTLATWIWATGGGVVNGTWLVGTVPSTTTFTITPTTCPLTGSNPTVVGTVTVQPTLQLASPPTTPVPATDVLIGSSGAAQVPLTIQGKAGQAVNLQEWKDSTGATGLFVGSTGLVQHSSGSSLGYNIRCIGEITLGSGNTSITEAVSPSTIEVMGSDYPVLQLGTNTAPFSIADTNAGPDITLRARSGGSTSGMNAGGSIILQPGAGAGGGAAGTVQCPGTGTNSVCIGPGTAASNTGSIQIGSSNPSNPASGYGAVGIGTYPGAVGAEAIAIGYTPTASAADAIALGTALANTAGAFAMNATPITQAVVTSTYYSGSSAEAILATDEVDVTQAQLTRGANDWTVILSVGIITIDTVVPHKFSINQQITLANFTVWDTAYPIYTLSGNTYTVLTRTATTFTFNPGAGLNAPLTHETTPGATLTPGDILLALSTNTSFYPTECFVWESGAGVINAQPTIRFGMTNLGGEYVAPVVTSGLAEVRTRNRFLTFATDKGSNTLTAGIVTPGTVTSGTPKIRFGFKGAYVRDS